MHSILVESSTLAAVVYDRRTQLLQLEFRDGTSYQYSAVPISIYQELLSSPSKGRYFNHTIRGRFLCEATHPGFPSKTSDGGV
jgi:hypothetical protein